MVAGIVFSILASLCCSLYILQKKYYTRSPLEYLIYLGFSFTLFSAVFYVVVNWTGAGYHEEFFSVWQLLSVLMGVVWFFASWLFYIAIDKIGLSKSNQWKNLQGPIGSIMMLILLSEFSSTNLVFALLGILFIFLSAVLLTVRSESAPKKELKIGILFSILSAVLFAINAFLSKFLTNKGFIYSKNIYFAFFVFLPALIMFLAKNKSFRAMDLKNPQNIHPIWSGIIYGLYMIFSVLAYTKLAGSMVFGIIQLNAVWTILFGVFVFKEIDFKQHWVRIVLGMILAIVAVVFMVRAL